MPTYYHTKLGRMLFSSSLSIILCSGMAGAETNAPRSEPALSGPTLLKAKEIEMPAEPIGPDSVVAPPEKTPQNEATTAKIRLSPAKETASTAGAPHELPPAVDANRPSPLRIEISPSTSKQKSSSESKILMFKSDADSSSMAAKLKASSTPADGSHALAEKNTPAKVQNPVEVMPPALRDQSIPEEELQPIAPDDAPGAIVSDRNESKPSEKRELKPMPESGELQATPEEEDAGPAPLEAASFNGVTPGLSTLAEVEAAWGPPKEMFKQNDLMTQLYSIPPFDRIEVGYEKDRVVSVVVRFQKPFDVVKIAQQLDMASIKPVLISNDMGEILGQSYPERGVLFAFEPAEDKSQPSSKVTHIMLEPIGAEPFILRAETELETRYDRSLQDLQIALDLQPENPRANWLASRVYAALQDFAKAEAMISIAVNADPKNVRYCISHSQILGQMGHIPEAIQETQKAIELSADQPHLRAKALCLKGDLIASGPKPDYRKAIAFHSQALRTADSVAADEHPAVRRMAKEALVDAHLGSAHDIAWGDWKEKDKAVTMWLKRATVIATDLMKNEDGSMEQLFRVHTRALSAILGIRTNIDPKPWLEEALTTGNELIASTHDPIRKAQYQWDLGMALYDAVQIYQSRSNNALALQYGQTAIEYLELGYAGKQTPTAGYLLGRLYFRLGVIHAIRDEDHASAVTWFEKAVPLLDQPVPAEAQTDLGRFGESFVSMGVSYWYTGDREKAVDLTKKGVKFMEEAVSQGTLERSALVTPYSNLAAMQRQVGATEEAAHFAEMAAKIKNSKTR